MSNISVYSMPYGLLGINYDSSNSLSANNEFASTVSPPLISSKNVSASEFSTSNITSISTMLSSSNFTSNSTYHSTSSPLPLSSSVSTPSASSKNELLESSTFTTSTSTTPTTVSLPSSTSSQNTSTSKSTSGQYFESTSIPSSISISSEVPPLISLLDSISYSELIPIPESVSYLISNERSQDLLDLLIELLNKQVP